MSLCQYKYIFGVPGEGAHFHVGGVAIVDVLLTVIAAFGISKYWNVSFAATLIVLFLIATFLHAIFCVPTSGLRFLGLA